MATFESKVSDIFSEHPRLARKIPVVIRKIFKESEAEFRRRINQISEHEQQVEMMKLFDILFIDFYFDELEDRFLSWVIKNYPKRFTSSELDEMHAQAFSHLDFYEIQEAIPGKGSYFKSLTTNTEGFLKDISSSSVLVKWDILLGRYYFYQDTYFATGATSVHSQNDKEYILEQIEKTRQEYFETNPGADYTEFAKNRWDIFYKIDDDLRNKAKNKKFYTTFGELQFCEVRFNIKNFQAILNTIDNLDEFEFVEAKTIRRGKKRRLNRFQFDWLTLGIEDELNPIRVTDFNDGLLLKTQQLDVNGNDIGDETIGTFYLDVLLGRLETRSLELAEFARHHFVDIFQGALTFKRINKLDIDIKSKIEAESDETEPPPMNEIDPALKARVEEQLFEEMLNDKIPMLNNKTPREASQIPELHPKLIDWLKGLENMMARRQKSGESTASIEKIKRELGIDW